MGTPDRNAQPALYGWLFRGYNQPLFGSIVISGIFNTVPGLRTPIPGMRRSSEWLLLTYLLSVDIRAISSRDRGDSPAGTRAVKSLVEARANPLSYFEPRALGQGRPSGSLKSTRPCLSVPDGDAQAGGLLWGGDDGVEAEHRHEQNGHKGDRNQESLPSRIEERSRA